MHLIVLSILAIVNLSTWKYAYSYKAGIVAYTPAFNKFPVQSTYVQGYARYIDDKGVQRLIAYTYPKPFYQVRQPVSYVKSAFVAGTPLLKTIGPIAVPNQQNKASDLLAARESHFLTWAQQQYQALKTDIDILRNAGKQPSANMIEKLLRLEKIATTTDFASIREHPDVKLIREEHLRLWNEAASKTLHADVQSPFAIKSFEDILEQKLPYGSHLLLQNPQITDLKQLEVNRLQERNQSPLPKILYYGEGQNIYQPQHLAGVQQQLRLWNTNSEIAAHFNRKQPEVHSPDIHRRVYINKDTYTPSISGGDAIKPSQTVQAEAERLQHNIPENQHDVKTSFNGVQSFGQQVLYGAPSLSNTPLFGNKVFQGVLSNTQYHPSSAIDDYNDMKSTLIEGQSIGKHVVQDLQTNTPYHLNPASKVPQNAESTFAQQPVQDLKSSSHYAGDVVQNYHDVKSELSRGQPLGGQGVGQPTNNYATQFVHLEMPSTYQELLKQQTFVSHPESLVDSVSAGEYAGQQQVGEQNTVAHAYDAQPMHGGLLKLHGVQSLQPHVLEQTDYVLNSGVFDGHYGVKSVATPEHSVQHSSGGHPISTLQSVAYNPHGVIGDNYNGKALDPSNVQHATSHQIYNANSNLSPKNNLKTLHENQEDPKVYISKSEHVLEQFVNEHNVGPQIKKSYSNITPGNYYEASMQDVQGIQNGLNHNRYAGESPLVEAQQNAGNQNAVHQPAEHRVHGTHSGLTQDYHGDSAKPLFAAERSGEHSVQDTHANFPAVHNLAAEVHNGVKSHLGAGQSAVQQGVTSQVQNVPALGSYTQQNVNSLSPKEQGQQLGKQKIYDVHSTTSSEHSNVPENQYDGKTIEETLDVTQHKTSSLGRPSIAVELPARQDFAGLQISDGRHGENSAVKSQIREGSSDQLHQGYFHSPSTALQERFQQQHNIGRHIPNIHSNSYINSAAQDHYGVNSPLSEGQSTKHHAVDPQKPSVVFDSSAAFDISNQQIRRYQEQAHIGTPLSGQQHPNPAEVQADVSYDHDVLLDNSYGAKTYHDRDQSSVQTYNTQQIDGNPIGKQDQLFLQKKSSENNEAEQHSAYIKDTQKVINQVKSVFANHPSIAGIVPTVQQSVHIEDTPEVKRAREEHFRIFNQIKANAVQHAQAKAIVLGPSVDDVAQVVDRKQFENTQEAREQFQEKLNLQRQRIREAERLQKEQEQLQFEQERDAERLAEERRQMEAELIHFKEEEKKRAAMDKLLEATQLQKQFSPSNDYNKNSDETGSQGSALTSNSDYYNQDKSNVKANNEMPEQPVAQFISEPQFKHNSNTEQNQQYHNAPNVAASEMVQNFQTPLSINKSGPTSEYQTGVQFEDDNEHVHNGLASNKFQELQKAVNEHLPSHEGAAEQSTITSKDC